ncbi:uncharacterized protein LOC105828312 [Monomorium pharaonis]|uniref:uncharacterized protein LOC105828312 n=1 Tax=Monomorium pharaonis TaxID=307658 RepID=UPI001745E9F6|nr:uncharacterized protein LOC105828312 [Monomorium pharaonis]
MRGWRNKKEELIKRVWDYDILILTELKIKTRESIRITGYDSAVYIENRQLGSAAGGVAILIRQEIKEKEEIEIDTHSNNIEAVAVKIKLKEEKEEIGIIGIYRRPGATENKDVWTKIVQQMKKVKSLIVAGDFNAHHRAWNCKNTDRNGEILLEEMEERELFTVNNDTVSRIGEGGVNDSNLDIMFATKEVYEKMTYNIEEDSWASDHYPIVFELGWKKDIYKKRTNRISKSKTKWKKYIEYMKEEERILEETEYRQKNEQDKYTTVTEKMKEAIIMATSNIKYVWNKMKIMKNAFHKMEWNKWQNKKREETIRKEIEKIAVDWVERKKEELREMEEDEDVMNLPFREEEMMRAINTVREKSAPGKDQIEYKMIKLLTNRFKEEVLKLFNYCYENSVMFKEWKEQQTIFIDKANKEKVRPITLSSCMGKILERMINERLI